MLYLNEAAIGALGIGWDESIEAIRQAVDCLAVGDFAQPIKPYLRYRNPNNRIIAMPAFLGGPFNAAGIKWIASFPENLRRGIPRAHSVFILNDADTGVPVALVDTSLLSIVRTVSVSGLMMKAFDEVRPLRDFTLGITGFGPIGRAHLAMISALFGPRLRKVKVFDPGLTAQDLHAFPTPAFEVAGSWQDVYDDADVFVTCTVSRSRYVDRPPKAGSLHLNVSLRDYTASIFEHVKEGIVVDDWDEVCRENTDIEVFHEEQGLEKRDVRTLVDVVHDRVLRAYLPTQPILFNPMGMAVFDVAVATLHYRRAVEKGIGTRLASQSDWRGT